MKRLLLSIIAFLAIVAIGVFLASGSPRIADTAIFVASDIVTMGEASASAPRAILVQGGIIEAIGSVAEMEELAAPGAERIEFGEAAIIPGLIEVHTHPLAGALLGAGPDISGFTHASRAEIMATLEQAAAGSPLSPWLIAFGWDPVLIEDLVPPTLEELDAVSPDRPLVVLTQMMHDAYANSAALAAAGVDENTANPPGAEFVRDQQGRLTGTVREVAAIEYLLRAIPPPPAGAAEMLLSLRYAEYASAGYTTVGVLGPAGNTSGALGLFAELAEDPQIPLRTIAFGLPSQIDEGGWRPGPTGPRFTLRGVKFWMDGSPFAGGAAWAEPYENTELTLDRLHLPRDHMPALNHDAADFEAEFERFHRAGFVVAVHVQGERAVDRVLDTVAAVQKRFPRSDARHRIEHNALITREQLQRALDLGVTPSFFIDHIHFYGHRLPEIVGVERSRRYMPVGSAVSMGHRATLHSDNPATPIDPMRVLQTALLRQTRSGGVVMAADERLTSEQALRAMTIDAAWQLGMEERIGSIEVGKAADFTVLARNPLAAAPEELRDIAVVGTWIDGQPVDVRPWRRANIGRGIRTVLAALFG